MFGVKHLLLGSVITILGVSMIFWNSPCNTHRRRLPVERIVCIHCKIPKAYNLKTRDEKLQCDNCDKVLPSVAEITGALKMYGECTRAVEKLYKLHEPYANDKYAHVVVQANMSMKESYEKLTEFKRKILEVYAEGDDGFLTKVYEDACKYLNEFEQYKRKLQTLGGVTKQARATGKFEDYSEASKKFQIQQLEREKAFMIAQFRSRADVIPEEDLDARKALLAEFTEQYRSYQKKITDAEEDLH